MPRPRKQLSQEDSADLDQKKASKEATKIKKQCIERVLKTKHTNWPCQIGIMNKLVSKYPDLSFWSTFDVNFSFTIPSMAWFLTEKGNDYLAQEYRRATTDLSALIQPRETPKQDFTNQIVEKVEIKKKMLTLKDFLG
jgi:hypothetical protein